MLHKWHSSNYNIEVHSYVENKKYCVVNNLDKPQQTTVFTGNSSSFNIELKENEIV